MDHLFQCARENMKRRLHVATASVVSPPLTAVPSRVSNPPTHTWADIIDFPPLLTQLEEGTMMDDADDRDEKKERKRRFFFIFTQTLYLHKFTPCYKTSADNKNRINKKQLLHKELSTVQLIQKCPLQYLNTHKKHCLSPGTEMGTGLT